MSAVAALFAGEKRGGAISRIFAAQLFGMALGPVVGVVASVRDLGWAFFATGVVSLAAAFVAFRTNVGDAAHDRSPLPKLQWNPQLIGALFATSAGGLCVGVYEACWSLLMHSHHATSLEIRLSWTMFAIPWVALSRVGGWLADHGNRRLHRPRRRASMVRSSSRSTPTSTTTWPFSSSVPSNQSGRRCRCRRSLP